MFTSLTVAGELTCETSFDTRNTMNTNFRFHGCPKAACSKNADREERERKYNAFEAQKKLLVKEHGYNPAHIHTTWGCEWAVERETPKVKKILEEHGVRPLHRLEPQKGVKASLNDSYNLLCDTSSSDTSSSSPGRRLFAADVSSLFPHICLSTSFPVGPCHKRVGHQIELSKLSFQGEEFLYDGIALLGLAQVRILPPSGLFRPFLVTTIKDNSLAVLCRTCAETKQQQPCQHGPQERALVDVWTTPELAFAISTLGYKLLDCFELMLYKEKSPFLEKFTTLLAFEKIRHAELPNGVCPDNPEHLQAYCDQLNTEMLFQQRIGKELQPRHLQPSKLLRGFYKKSLNNWIGMFSCNLERRTETKFIDDVDQLALYGDRIVGITTLQNTDKIQVTISGARPVSKKKWIGANREDPKISRKSCATIGGFVTGLSRLFMYKKILHLIQHNAEILKIASDALYFSTDLESGPVLEFSEAFGKFKHVYPGELLALAQVGVMNYAVMFRSEDGLVHSEAKCSGLVLSAHTTNELNFIMYKEALNKIMDEKCFDLKSTTFQQVRKKTDAKNISYRYVRGARSVFSRNILNRRTLCRQQTGDTINFVTYPYGYVSNNVQ
jgi:hypothetical protein